MRTHVHTHHSHRHPHYDMQLHYTPFEPDDVDAALKARDAGGDGGEAAARLTQLSPFLRNILMGGLLYVRIKKVGGWWGHAVFPSRLVFACLGGEEAERRDNMPVGTWLI